MRQTYIAQVKAHDNYKLEVKIDYPGKSDGIVIFCHGSGPNTYDNPREIEGTHFNYFDLFADEFCGEALPSAAGTQGGALCQIIPPTSWPLIGRGMKPIAQQLRFKILSR